MRVILTVLVLVNALLAVRPTYAQAVDCAPHSYPQRTDQSLAVDPFDDRIVYVGVEGEGFGSALTVW